MNFSFELPQAGDSVQAGGELAGKLYITVKKPVKGTLIKCEFQGYEQTTIQHTASDGNGGSTTHILHGNHLKYRKAISVPNQDRLIQNGKLVPGDYVVPFCVRIPSNLLPTSKFATKGPNSARIEYCLRVELKNSGMLKNYQSKKTIKVTGGRVAQTVVQLKPQGVAPQTKEIKRMGLLGFGRISYGAKIANTSLVQGEAPAIQLAILNDSQTPVQFVQTEMHQVVKFSAQSASETIQTCLGRKRVLGRDIPGSAPLDREGRKQAKDNDWSCGVLQALQGGDSVSYCLPPVPADAMATYKGGIIKISHELSVKIKTPEGLVNPEFLVPIHISHGVSAGRSSTSSSQSTLPVAFAQPIYNTEDTTTVTSIVYKPSMDAKVGLGMGRNAQGQLVVTSVGGLFEREGSLQKGMRILEINGISQGHNDPHQAVSVLRNATSQVIVVAQN